MRIDGWEARLAGVIEWARDRPYVLGEHDCFRVACAAVQALTGRDLWAEHGGTYRTRREALARLAELGGTFEEAFTRLFGCDPKPAAQARRGDIVQFHDGVESHLGVCVGDSAAVLREGGMGFVQLKHCLRAWGI